MKHTKKMRLVECSVDNHQEQIPNISTQNVKDEDYFKPRTLQNLDNEMETILSDTTTDIDRKWLLYHQALQRYLGFIKRMRQGGNSNTDNMQDSSELSRGSVFNTLSGDRESRRFSSHTSSTPKKNDTRLGAMGLSRSTLPIRIQKQFVRQQQRMANSRKKKSSTLLDMTMPSDSTTLRKLSDGDDEYDDEEYDEYDGDETGDVYHDLIDGDDNGNTTAKTATRPSGITVNGWTGSNIKK